MSDVTVVGGDNLNWKTLKAETRTGGGDCLATMLDTPVTAAQFVEAEQRASLRWMNVRLEFSLNAFGYGHLVELAGPRKHE